MNKIIGDLYKFVNEFVKGYPAWLNIIKNENEKYSRILTPSSTDGKTISSITEGA